MSEVPLVRLLSMAVGVALEELHAGLAERGHGALRPAHGYALNAVLQGHDTVSEVAPHLGMTKQGAAKLVQHLVDGGYLELGDPGSRDARRKPLVLTERGHDAVQASLAIQAEIEQRWGDLVGHRRMTTARTALESAVTGAVDGGYPPVRPGW